MKDNLVYLEHIIECINKIKKYSDNLSKKEFIDNEVIQDAIIRNIEIIGEASKNLSKDFKQTYPEIPWKEITGMRDKLIHHYIGVDIDVVWKTIEVDIPILEKLLQKIK